MKNVRLLLLLSLAAAAAPACAAIVRLKDGGTLEGTVVRADATEVVVRTAGGPRTVDAAQVQSIEYEAAAAPPVYAAPRSAPIGAGEDTRRPFDGKNLFSIGLGFAAPLSDVDFKSAGGGTASNGDLGPMIGVRYLHSITSRFALGADLDYLHRSATDSPGLLPLADASVMGDNLLFMGLARWHVIDHGSVRPYLLGGLGVSRSWTRIDARPIPGFTWTDTNTDEARRLVDDGAWAFASTARLGLDFDWDFAEPAVFSLEGGWTGLQSKRSAATRAGQDLGVTSVSGRLNLFTLAARWSWRW